MGGDNLGRLRVILEVALNKCLRTHLLYDFQISLCHPALDAGSILIIK
ncbi:protein of unknown function [Candidatus Methylopumilus turicensis]|uniref:Uncharacterized protein n=1 Tax=Candidatus Methylopumilus turicensis TaxID=1581680 RepID=A0A0B7IWT3_9PROT|nr:protein of unknown function [Candidatus Methylopumilus turicensis]